ncbi:MAG: maleylpyruvate isomerase N-terminal domain-containing protein [Actinomycetota bacterium]|nr:maleylpyruvate isomerase N-terminal domain-containing protein [Actinomycetota bacterium]
MCANELLELAYRPLLAFAEQVDDVAGWTPTLLPGWTARDLLFHLASDCQRALVAFATPASSPVDTDEISYWSHWKPGTAGAQAGLRGTRIMASAWGSVRGPADLYLGTARAVLSCARGIDPSLVITTQGATMTANALMSTLAVEAGVHQLDLEPVLAEPPATPVLAEIRRVLDGLLGEPMPLRWEDVRYIRIGTGRLPIEDAERAELGGRADRFPLFG